MTDPVFEAQFRKPFLEQVAAYRLRLGNLVPTERWDDIRTSAHDRAFMVAGAQKMDLLEDFAEAIGAFIERGETLDMFENRFREIVERNGWHGWTGEGSEAGEAWRIRTIYKTNMAVSYAAGRRAQLIEGNYPYWIYRHSGAEHPRLHHMAWDGLVLPPSHPFWTTHSPPNGWGCGCRIFGARSLEHARRKGGIPEKTLPENWAEIDPRTGERMGIGKGWGYAPGASVTDTIRLTARKLSDKPELLSSGFASGFEGILARYWPAYLADLEARGSHEPALAGFLIDSLVPMGGTTAGRPVFLKPGLVSGPKAERHQQKGDALSEAEWLDLPDMLSRPDTVYLDTRTGSLVYHVERNGRLIQIVVDRTARVKRDRKQMPANLIVSAYVTDARVLAQRLSEGRFVKLVLEM